MRVNDLIAHGDAKVLVKLIQKFAKPWLLETQADITLYRGIHREILSYDVFPIPKDRPPVDTGLFRHNVFNAMITAAGGYANRSNSVFTSREFRMASAYGSTYVFIPLGDFRYTFSPVWTDWTARVDAAQILPLLNKKALFRVFQFFREQLPNEPLHWVMTNVRHHLEKALAGANSNKHSKEKNKLPPSPWEPLINEILQDPNSYDKKKLSKVITADRDLHLMTGRNEIMISAEQGLYINPELYREFVLPELQMASDTRPNSSFDTNTLDVYNSEVNKASP